MYRYTSRSFSRVMESALSLKIKRLSARQRELNSVNSIHALSCMQPMECDSLTSSKNTQRPFRILSYSPRFTLYFQFTKILWNSLGNGCVFPATTKECVCVWCPPSSEDVSNSVFGLPEREDPQRSCKGSWFAKQVKQEDI